METLLDLSRLTEEKKQRILAYMDDLELFQKRLFVMQIAFEENFGVDTDEKMKEWFSIFALQDEDCEEYQSTIH